MKTLNRINPVRQRLKHCALALAIFGLTDGTLIAADNTGTGGTITYTDSNGLNPVASPPYSGGYVIHTFTSSDTLTIPFPVSADVLVVAGGGQGGYFAGGGGAGGLIYSNAFAVSAGATTVTVGNGGSGVTTDAQGARGENSVLPGTSTTLTAAGGGGGGSRGGIRNGASGGSGGGGSGADDATKGVGGAASPAGQGNAGGNGAHWGAGGGGGAGFAGSNASGEVAGKGGDGLAYSISGSSVYYAGGGGGGTWATNTVGAGGLGGGASGINGNLAGIAATPNSGGGGGGGSLRTGGSGGSGIVIVRYPYLPDEFSIALANPANGQTLLFATPVSATAMFNGGTAPTEVKFYLDSNLVSTTPGATNPLTVDLGTLSPGTHTLYATATDNTLALVTSATRTFTVIGIQETTTVLAAAGPATIYGENVTFTATVSPAPPGGTVQFSDGLKHLGVPVAVDTVTGEASVNTNTLGAGTHEITAEYSGYQTYTTSTTAASISQTVNKAPLTVKATSYTRPPNAPDPIPLPSAILGFVNGERLTTSGVSGTPDLTTAANSGSAVGTYTITCAVGTLAASNYSFTPENGTLTVAVPVPTTLIFGGDFEMYKPGTLYYVPAAFTNGSSYAAGVGDGKSLSGGTITYSDGATGYTGDGIPDFDLPGWEFLQSGNDLLANGVGGSTGCNIFAAWGGDGRIQTTGSLFTVAAGQSVTITAMVGGPAGGPIEGPLAFHLVANGVQLVPTSSVNPTPPYGGAFQMISRTYSAAVLAPHLGATTKIVLGVEDANNFANRVIFDDVKLEMTSAPAGYGTWASTNAPGQTPDEDYDNDGVENGIEYFMGETGSSFTAMPGLDGTNTVTWPMDPAYNGTYEVQTSPDLGTWTNVAPRPTPAGGNLSYTLTSGLGKNFVRLLVTPAP